MARLEQISRNNKKGYKSSDGTIVIEPQFDDCIWAFGLDSYPSRKYASVAIKGKCGMINESGETVIPLEYQEVIHLFDDLFAVRKAAPNNSWFFGVINPSGDIVIPFDYKYIVNIGRFLVCYKEADSSRIYTHTQFDTSGSVYKYFRESHPFVYNSEGRLIFEGDAISSNFDHLVTVVEDKYGVIDYDGNSILKNQYDEICIASRELFIVRINNEESWSFGVINKSLETAIDFTYKFITTNDGVFFECFKECESTKVNNGSNKKPYEYRNQSEEYWLNSKGGIIYNGKAEVLSKKLLACDKDGRKAVFDIDGNKIVNFQYDSIQLLDNYLIVEKDHKVGVLTDFGNVVIDARYDSIEFVHIDDSVTPRYTHYGIMDGNVYGSFSKQNVFDTSSDNDRLNRKRIQYVKGRGITSYSGISCPRDHYSFNDIMILRTDSYAELFSLEEGIVHNSRYDTIQQLTNVSYAVSKDDKFGVYRRDIHQLILDCDYERIVFEGGHVALVFKDGMWGAKSLVLPEHPFYPLIKVDVPIQFKEISILDSFETLFGVKHDRTNYREETLEEYTIVNNEGKMYKNMEEFIGLSSMPVLYDENHILTSQAEKFGFVSANGYVSVPFIYDEIIEREDSLFDVRMDTSWGVIDLLGKVIVSTKYDSQIKGTFDNLVVADSLTERLGVLGADGREKVPTVCEHLMMKERVIYYGYGGHVDDSPGYSGDNFFSGTIRYAKWGVISKDGAPIIDPIYDCFKEQDGFILAGRDGEFLGEGQHDFSYHENEYSGVYDLYDYEGNMLLGGFTKFHKDEKHNLLYFHFGGRWEQECEDYDKWGNAVYYYSYHWIEGNGRWLVTDLNLTSIIPKKDGTPFTFRKGAKCTITTKKQDGKITSYWSFPLEQMSVKRPIITNGCFVVGDENSQRVIRLKDKATSRIYNNVNIIDNEMFFTYERSETSSGVGISSFEQELISCDRGFSLVTKPTLDSIFAVLERDDNNYTVVLLDYKDAEQSVIAIDKVEYWDLIGLLKEGKLQLLPNGSKQESRILYVRDKSVFDDSFIKSCRIEEKKEKFEGNVPYWFSVDIHISLDSDKDINDYYDGGNDDDWDYERETWHAMTDGMYGDMPEGFDGDYSFMGR